MANLVTLAGKQVAVLSKPLEGFELDNAGHDRLRCFPAGEAIAHRAQPVPRRMLRTKPGREAFRGQWSEPDSVQAKSTVCVALARVSRDFNTNELMARFL